jgi:NADH-quinone oxidoreductase subunit C
MPDEIQPVGASNPAEKPVEEKKAVPATASTSPAAELPGPPAEPKPASPEAPKPTAEKPVAAAEKPAAAAPAAKPDATAAVQPVSTVAGAPKPAAATPAGAAKPAAVAGAVAKPPAAPPKPPAPKPDPWESPLIEKLRKAYGSGLREASTYMKQNYMVVDKSIASDVLRHLRDQEQFDYCVDVTAVHYPKREEQFEVVWILYSFARNERVRVKTQIKEGEPAPSAVPLWPTANWLEREVFDMFGIHFTGHPDLRRILMPDDWKGHPLRKDYGLMQQDQDWVKINLGIESGQ